MAGVATAMMAGGWGVSSLDVSRLQNGFDLGFRLHQQAERTEARARVDGPKLFLEQEEQGQCCQAPLTV